MIRVRRALPRLVLFLAVAMGSTGCVSSHGNDTLTFDGRRYVLEVFLDDAHASRMRVEPIGTASQAEPQWVTDRTVYRVVGIDPSQIVLMRVDPTRWDTAESGSEAPALAAFATADSDLTQPEVSERLAGALPPPAPDRVAALAAAEARWASRGSVTYRFTIALTWLVAPEWSGPFTFFVREGKPYEVFRGKDPLSLEDKTLTEVPRTVPELFADASRLIGSDGFDIRFDEELGYPVELKVDVNRAAIDDEGGWLVTNLEVVSAVP